jgi:hypothetical protein
MRYDEGSLLRIRNAAQQQVFNGSKVVRATNQPSMATKAAQAALRHGATAVGASHGPLGAIAGRAIGENLGDLLTPEGMTRDALVKRSFELTQPNAGVRTTPFAPTLPAAAGVGALATEAAQ